MEIEAETVAPAAESASKPRKRNPTGSEAPADGSAARRAKRGKYTSMAW
jgi:hypothetical protein